MLNLGSPYTARILVELNVNRSMIDGRGTVIIFSSKNNPKYQISLSLSLVLTETRFNISHPPSRQQGRSNSPCMLPLEVRPIMIILSVLAEYCPDTHPVSISESLGELNCFFVAYIRLSRSFCQHTHFLTIGLTFPVITVPVVNLGCAGLQVCRKRGLSIL